MTNKTGIFSRSKGSGKSTTCAYLAAALTLIGKKVVCIDVNGDLQKYLHPNGSDVQVADLSWKYRRWNGEEDRLTDEADYILVDIPSCSFEGSEAILQELDSVLIPVEAEYYGLDELNQTLLQISQAEHLLIAGIVLTKADGNSSSPQRIEAVLKEYFSHIVLNSVILRNYYLSGPVISLTDLSGKGWHSGFINYLKLANELIEHEC